MFSTGLKPNQRNWSIVDIESRFEQFKIPGEAQLAPNYYQTGKGSPDERASCADQATWRGEA